MNRVPSVRRRRRRRFRIKPIRFFFFVAIVISLIVFIRWFVGLGNSAGFCQGIYVNGTSLGGMSYEQGMSLIAQKTQENINERTYQLQYGDRSWTFTPSMLGAWTDASAQVELAWNYGHVGNWFARKEQIAKLRAEHTYLESEMQYDEQMLNDFVIAVKSEIDREPQNAGIIETGRGSFTTTESAEGLRLDADALKAQLIDLMRNGGEAVIALSPEIIEPAITSAQMDGTTELIATCSTTLAGSGSDRTSNVRTALQRFDGKVIGSGEVCDFNAIVGKRTESMGFKKAPEYAGDKVIEGTGGGVCQASTTLYGAALRAGMTILDRDNHTMTVSYVDLSLDAAVNDNGGNFIFRNDTLYPIYIFTEVTSKSATVWIYGKQPKYRIELESEKLETIAPEGASTRPDLSGKYIPFGDNITSFELEKGKDGARSRGYRMFYDRTTGELVNKQLLSEDTYQAKKPIMLVGAPLPEMP